MESYVSKEVAKLLYENGFEAKDKTDACPTLKMAQEWLADKHHLFVVVEPDDMGSAGFRNSLYQEVDGQLKSRGCHSSKVYDTEDACVLAGVEFLLKYTIPLIKHEKKLQWM